MSCLKSIKMNLKQLNVLLLGAAFHLIFFSFQTSVFVQQTVVNSLVSQPNSNFHGNAYLSLCITYSVFALSNWLAPSIIAVTGVKYGMFLGACTYVVYSASFLYPTTWLFYTAAGLIGLGAAPLWTGQGAFLAKQSDQNTMNKNAAIFWSLLQSSLLFGNLFVYLTFEETRRAADPNDSGDTKSISDETRYLLYGVLTMVCAAGALVLLFLRDGSREEMSSLNSSINSDCSSAKSTRETGSVDWSSSRNSIGSCGLDSEKTTALGQFLGAIKLAKSGDMLLLSTVFIFTGQLLSFFTGVYGTAIGATSQFGTNPKKFIGLVGIAIGIGEIFGGSLFGLIGARGFGNKLRRDSVFVLGFVILISALSLTYINLPPDSPLAKHSAQQGAIIDPRLWISMVASVMIGFSDACFNTQVYSMLMSAYKDNSVPAFALFKFTQSIGSAVAFLYSTELDLYFQIVILATISTVATICFCLVEWRTRKSFNIHKGDSHSGVSPSSVVTTAGLIEKSESQQSILRGIECNI